MPGIVGNGTALVWAIDKGLLAKITYLTETLIK